MNKVLILLLVYQINLFAKDILDFFPKNFDFNMQDSSQYIQKAVDTGEDIKIKKGIYLIAKPIILSYNNQKIYGKGTIRTKAKFVFLINKKLNNIIIENLTLINLGSKSKGYNHAVAIYVNKKKFGSINNSLFYNIQIIGFGIGINLTGYEDNKSSISTNTIKNCKIYNSLAKKRIGSGGGHGIYVKKGIFNILDNKIENMQGGILFSAQGIISDNTLIDTFDDNGIYLAHAKDVIVKRNYIYVNKTDGIAVNNSENIIISNNIIKKSRNGCIRIQEGKNILLNQNICSAYGLTNHFIRGYARRGKKASSSIVISNNIFNGPLTGKGNPIIFKRADTIYKDIMINNNIIKNIDTTQIKSKNKKNLIIYIQNSFNNFSPSNCQAKNNQIINYRSNRKKDNLFKGINQYENSSHK